MLTISTWILLRKTRRINMENEALSKNFIEQIIDKDIELVRDSEVL